MTAPCPPVGRHFTKTAYLVVTLDVTGVVPCVYDVGVYSSNGAGLTTMSGQVRADLFHVDGPSYHEAHKRLVDLVNSTEYYAWVRPWLTEGLEAVAARDNLRNCLHVAASMVGARTFHAR